jgi:hypothetical protein
MKRGMTVQEQTASNRPAIAATGYDIIFLVSGPRYFIIESVGTKTIIAPAMKNAGIKHKST